MKLQTIFYLIFALLLGLFAGYLLFGNAAPNEVAAPSETHSHSGEIWTCSMHPQIQRDEPGDCPICGMDLIPLAADAGADPTVLTMSEAAVALARVRTLRVGLHPSTPSAPDTLRLTGRLAADERTTAVEVTEFGGRIERLFVSFAGERVRAGQRIATIYSPDLVVAQEELLQARGLSAIDSSLRQAARTKLRNLKLTPEQIAELERTGEVIETFPVYADQAGTVLEMKAEVGQYLPPGGALYTYTDLSKLWALFDAYEDQLAATDIGDRVRFSVNGRPDESYTARVTFIDPIIDPQTRTAAVRAEVNNRGGALKAGMFIRGTLTSADEPLLSSRNSADELTVPTSAVLWTGERSVVYVAVEDAAVPTYQFREVQLGERLGNSYRVLEGLEAGEEVVTQGAFQIDAAAQLRNQASMMKRDVIIAGREEEAVTAMTIPDYRDEAPTPFQDQLATLARAYLPLKDAMVASRLPSTEIVAKLRQAITAVDMSLVEDEAHLYWMQQLRAMGDHLTALANTDTVDEARRQFGFLSQALINSLTAFGVDGALYVQHCPMAFDNAGANWVSADPAIRNPYFGDAMLSCGYTLDTLGTTLQ
jgi:Cu(I)/Ag(I) efflux system membrane fusion protein